MTQLSVLHCTLRRPAEDAARVDPAAVRVLPGRGLLRPPRPQLPPDDRGRQQLHLDRRRADRVGALGAVGGTLRRGTWNVFQFWFQQL